MGEWQILWHPHSPGVKVLVFRWFPNVRRSEFATASEVIRSYGRRRPVDRTR